MSLPRSSHFKKRDDFCAMRALDFLPDGVGGEFNVFRAKVARHFLVCWFAQRNNHPAVRAGVFCP
jgi:hypothetical protein